MILTGLLAWCTLASAGTAVVVADGPLWPGRTATLEIASLSEAGAPLTTPPALSIEGGRLLGPPRPVRAGLWRQSVVPGAESAAVTLRAAGMTPAILPVGLPKGGLGPVAPPIVDTVAREPNVTFELSLPEGLDADDIEVKSAEGEAVITGTSPARVSVDLDDLPYARYVPVAIRAKGQEEEPTWTLIRARARLKIPLRAEPGAELTLQINSRTYGPFRADAQGLIEARVDQYPGETFASALLTDDLGNETRTEVPLALQPLPALLALSTGSLLPGSPPPLVYVRAVDAGGGAPKEPPVCVIEGHPLEMRRIQDGRYLVPLPPDLPNEDTRVLCSVGIASSDVRIDLARGVPGQLAMRVWPEEIVSAAAKAEVSVTLTDLRGEPLPPSGVALEALHGSIVEPSASGTALRARYDGDEARASGQDTLLARYRAPAGAGPLDRLEIRAGAVPASGPVQVFVRALDASRRPLQGISISAEIEGAGTASLRTGEGGWASGTIDLPERGRAEPQPRVLRASASSCGNTRSAAALLLPLEPATFLPGAPDLEVAESVALRPGRIDGISIEVDPPILRNSPGAVAWVYVRLEDSEGRPITDEPVELTATEGQVGELKVRSDGSLIAEYTPLPDDRSREVEITARTDAVRALARLQLEPKVMRWSLGIWAGGQSNLGSIRAPALGADLDVRVRSRLAGESMVLRLSGAATTFQSEAVTDVGPSVRLRSTLLPIGLSVLFRQDLGPWSLWGGGGGVVAIHALQVRFGETLVSSGPRALIGPQVLGGVGHRLLIGEILLTVSGNRLPAANDDVGYAGNLGGISGGLGYRLVF